MMKAESTVYIIAALPVVSYVDMNVIGGMRDTDHDMRCTSVPDRIGDALLDNSVNNILLVLIQVLQCSA